MDPGCHQRQEKHRQDLRPDGLLHLVVAHAHILQDGESLLILVAFRDLLVIHDKDGRHQEQDPQEDADEEQPGINAAEAGFFVGAAL